MNEVGSAGEWQWSRVSHALPSLLFSFYQSIQSFLLPMDKNQLPPKRRFIPPPSPIPTAKGSRSAADPILSEFVDKSTQIPELTLPQNARRFTPEEIDYRSLVSRAKDSVRRLLRSGREFGAFQIMDNGIPTEELRFALANGERVFGLTVECCASYGHHEMLVWRGDDQDITEEATAVIGQQHFQIFRQKLESVARQLEEIAQELIKVIRQSGGKQYEEPIQLGEATLSICRYRRPKSVTGERRSQEADPYALSLLLLLESSEFCLEPGQRKFSFDTRPGTIFVTIGKEIEEWSQGELKSAQGKSMFKPLINTNKPSFSIEQKWRSSNFGRVVGESSKNFSLADQILVLLVAAFLYRFFAYIFS